MRYFGVDEANRMVPHLARTFESVRGWLGRIEELKGRLAGDGGDPEHTVGLEAERATLVARVREALEPFEQMGLEVKAVDGLVDFRALRSGEVVYLCWRYGEEAVTHWHALDAGFAGRQPILRPGEFARTYLA
jgi:hypothetical protein